MYPNLFSHFFTLIVFLNFKDYGIASSPCSLVDPFIINVIFSMFDSIICLTLVNVFFSSNFIMCLTSINVSCPFAC
jgi:hypothetical protein